MNWRLYVAYDRGPFLDPWYLFISCINSLPQTVRYAKTVLLRRWYSSCSDRRFEHDMVANLVTNLNKCTTWLSNHGLALNIDKTKLMIIGTGPRLNSVLTESVELHDGSIRAAQEYKCLAMLLDKHAKYARYKVYQKLKTLGRIRSFVWKKSCSTLIL